MTDSTFWQRFTSEDNLYAAWLKVAGNMGAGGVDKVTIEDFELNLHENLGVIKSLLEKGNYAFLPLLKFESDKSSGDGKRILGIPAIRDRITQQAMVNILQPAFEPEFLDCSYAYRPRRSAHQALARVERYIKEGCGWVFDGDIKSFFDTVNHSLLLDLIAKKIDDERIITLIRNLLETGATSEDVGIPQGAVTSPLFSNIYLDQFDQEMTSAGYKLVRFADDCVTLAAAREEADEALKLAEDVLGKLELKLNEDKTHICNLSEGFVFLGYEFTESGKRPAPKSVWRFLKKLDISRDESPTREHLESIIRGWLNYFKLDAGTHEELTSEFQRILDNDPGSLPARLALTALYLRKNEPDKARGIITAVSAVASEDAEINYQHGVLCEELDMLSEATDDLLTAFRLNPEDGNISYRLGLLYLKNDQVDKALNFLQRAIRIAPDFASAHYALGMAYKNWGLHGVAKRSFDQALALDPGIAGRVEIESACEKDKEEVVIPDSFRTTDIDLFLGLFLGREGVYARQWIDDNNKCGYFPVREPFTDREAQMHLSGDLTVGLYLTRMDNTVKLMVIDIDVNKGALPKYLQDEETKITTDRKIQEDVARIKELCEQMGCPVYIEDSGYKGRHCWFFFEEPIEAREARGLAKSILKRVGEPPQNLHREMFPRQDVVSPDALGSVIKLPLGIHKASCRRCLFVDSNGRPYPDQIQVLREIKLISQDDVQRMKKSLQAGLTRAGEEPSDDVKKIMAGCKVIRFLVNKAKETGDLSHTERLVILYSLGHLDDEGKQYIHQVMSCCLNYNQRYTERWVRRLKPDINPISCAKIRDWLSDITPGIGCYCDFKLGRGAYPSPVLHVKPKATKRIVASRPVLEPPERPETISKENETCMSPEVVRSLPPGEASIRDNIALPLAGQDRETLSLEEEAVNVLVKEYIRLKREREGISKKIQDADDRLNATFDSKGINSLVTELGLLRRINREDKNSWVIEI
ncbi:MAG: CRISPR-associated primase-polymerase type A1 [bacterium]|nr:CRISPR-associated primase-polymerase type A1 [bacterium]